MQKVKYTIELDPQELADVIVSLQDKIDDLDSSDEFGLAQQYERLKAKFQNAERVIVG